MYDYNESVYLKMRENVYSAFLPYFWVPEYRNNDIFSLFIYFLLVDKVADRMLRMHKLEHIRAGDDGLKLLWNFQL